MKNLDSNSFNPFELGAIEMVVPTTASQREMWTSIKLDEKSSLCYNEALLIKINGSLDEEKLIHALKIVIERHEALRTVFSHDGMSAFIIDRNEAKVDCKSTNLSEQLMKDEIDVFMNTLFDLENGPNIKFRIYKNSEELFHLFIIAHHIICDGWSIAIIIQEISEIYNSLTRSEKIDLVSPYQFSEYAVWESRNGTNLNDKSFWLEYFSEKIPSRKFPSDFPRNKSRSFESKRIDFEFPLELIFKLKKITNHSKCSLYTVLTTAFNILQSKLQKNDLVVVGLSCAAQPAIEQGSLVGHFVNLLPLKLKVKEDNSFLDLLKINRTNMLNAFDHQFFGYGQIVKELKYFDRSTNEMPLLNIVFNIDQQSENQGLAFKDLKASYKSIPRVAENFEIFINIVSRKDVLELECQYNSTLFKDSTIRNWIISYFDLIDLLCEFPDLNISSLVLPNLYIPTTAINDHQFKESINLKINSEDLNKLKNIWKIVLEVESIDDSDNFFDLGGHSLLALELAEKISRGFNVNFSMKDVFERQSIYEMYHKILELNNTLRKENFSNQITPCFLEKIPLSNSQLQIIYLEEVNQKTEMHNLPSAIRIKSEIDSKKLEHAFNLLIQRQPMLRCSLVYEKNRPLQNISKELHFTLVEESISSESELFKKLNEEASYTFDLEKMPLFKAKLFKLAKNDFVLFFMAHHFIWDGWSFDIFFKELNDFYQDPNITLPPIKISYFDHVNWIRNNIEKGLFNSEISFWKNKLSLPYSPLSFPISKFNTRESSSTLGKTFYFTLDSKLSSQLRDLSKISKTSLFNIFLTAFKITLMRFAHSLSTKEDLIIGTPVRGRINSDSLDAIGYFVNTVAIRSTIDLNLSFKDNLSIVSNNTLEAYEHQNVPFQIVLNSLDIDKKGKTAPVFQTFFSYQDVSNRSGTLGGTKYTQINIDKASTHTELDLWIKSNSAKIEGGLEYRLDLFDESLVSSFYDSFINLLDNVAINVDKKILEIPVISFDLSRDQLILMKGKSDDSIISKNLIERIHHISLNHENEVAIYDDQSQLTYLELEIKSNQIANFLLNRSITVGSYVGVSLKRSPEMLIYLLGILKSGAAYVPLDPNFPKDRLDYMVELSSLDLMFCNRDSIFINDFKACVIENISFNNLDKKYVNLSSNKETAYVLFTSGSTGKPKGVEVTHLNLNNFIEALLDENILCEKSRFLAVTTLSFDISILELFYPISLGANIFIAKSDEVLNGSRLMEIIKDNKINSMQATPTTWRLLLANGLDQIKNFTVLCGGEPFPIDLAKKLTSFCLNVWNMYGPTETTVWSTCKKLSTSLSKITVGRPILNTDLFILDENLNLLPNYVPGNLYIGGYGVSKGYLKRNDLTSERFIKSPFDPNQIIYNTGDIARMLPNGDLECLGRNDGQVKIRGYRIELGEIEYQIHLMPEINECAVKTQEFKNNDLRLVAYYSLKDKNRKINSKTIKENLGKNLSSYMIPNYYVEVDNIPKTQNGKIDKKALPLYTTNLQLSNVDDSIVSESLVENSSQEFVTSNEIVELKRIWMEVLSVDNIQDSDNFFALGGNSILAMELLGNIGDKFNVNLKLNSLIETKNFEDFSKIIFNSNLTSNTLAEKQRSNIVNNYIKTLVTIQEGSNKKEPFICFHGAGGNVMNYVPLVQALSIDRSFYAFQNLGIDGETPLQNSIEEMAYRYYSELKMVRPNGPYILAGGSMGGLIALEVARIMQDNGDIVSKLIMFDTFGTNFDYQKYDSSFRDSIFKRLVFALKTRIEKFTKIFIYRIFNQIGLKVPMSILFFNIEINNYKAIFKYKALPLDVDLYLIRNEMENSGWYSDPNMGWSGIILGKIYNYFIKGNHSQFIESPQLITKLKNIINDND